MELIVGGFLLFVFHKAVDDLLGKAVDPRSNGILDGVIQRILKPFSKDRSSKRRQEFQLAVTDAANLTINGAANPSETRAVLEFVDKNYDVSNAGALAAELAKVMEEVNEPDLGKLAELIGEHQPTVASANNNPGTHPDVIKYTLGNFVTNFRRALISKPEYHYLIPIEQTKILENLLHAADPVQHENEAMYRRQMNRIYGAIDFVGIPDVPLMPSLSLDAQFLDLKLEEFQPESIRDPLDGPDQESLPVRRRSTRKPVFATDICGYPNTRLVLLGEAGTGKSTLLRRLVSQTTRLDKSGRHLLPIYVLLREVPVDNHGVTLEQHMLDSANRHLSLNLAPDFFHKQLESGNCLVCFDGADEVSTLHSQNSIRELITGFVSRFPFNTYIVSSRPAGYDAPFDPSEFVHYQILPLSPEQIDEFIAKWYSLTEIGDINQEIRSQELIGLIHNDPHFVQIAENPLLLTIILLVHRNEADLPKDRFKLYEKCVGTLLDTRNQQKGLIRDYEDRWFYKRRMKLLQSLAYKMQEQRGDSNPLESMTEDLLTEFVAENIVDDPSAGEFSKDLVLARQEAADFIDFAKARTGLLVGKSGGMLTFPHLTFQEFLAASYIDSMYGHLGFEGIWREIEPMLVEPKWREVILLLIGILTRAQRLPNLFLERMISQDENGRQSSNIHRGLFLSGIALSEGIVADDTTHHKIIDQLISLILRGSYAGEGRDALNVLMRLKGDRYLTARLCEILRNWHDKDLDVEFVFDLLGTVGGEIGLDLLNEFIDDRKAPEAMRFYAANTAGALGRIDETIADVHKHYISGGRLDGRTIPLLAKYFSKHEPFDFEVLETLSKWASSNSRGWVTGPALEALIQIGLENENATEIVLEKLELMVAGDTSQRQVVHSVVNEAGVALNGISAISKKFGRDSNRCLDLARQMIFDQSQDVRNVIGALRVVDEWGGWNDELISRSLEIANDESGDPMGRVQIIRWFNYKLTTRSEQLRILEGISSNPALEPRGRVWALGAQIDIDATDEKVVEMLGILTRSRNLDWIVRADAAEMLGSATRGNAAAVEILRSVGEDESENDRVRSNALRSLGRVALVDDDSTRTFLNDSLLPKNADRIQSGAYSGLKQLNPNM